MEVGRVGVRVVWFRRFCAILIEPPVQEAPASWLFQLPITRHSFGRWITQHGQKREDNWPLEQHCQSCALVWLYFFTFSGLME